MSRRQASRVVFAAALVLVTSVTAVACSAQPQKDAPSPQERDSADDNPTKIVLWSVRNEYFNLPGSDAWRNVILIRGDKAILRNKPKFPGRQGLLLRID